MCRRAATSPLEESPVVAHGISRNADRFLSLTETQLALEYRPRDDSSDVLDGTDPGRAGLETE
ncbi:hypothetical protein HALLA_13800 [Halostagnicola larsenii XH-48]|uniref:Uncharacterized protein n=1 Tax=Halostagnicola larsenii XH-48 TaxID=797299 RepID=W0JR08_9EURY|nr:hypothetical protein HALLA_13800 [Halostagnicola larsenii XH-48]